jgi:hypothetical protein
MNIRVWIAACLLCAVAGKTPASVLNEWTFEKDGRGLTLSQAVNSGSESAVFESGGAGFLLTDGQGGLRDTSEVSGPGGMWAEGAVLDAEVTSVTSGVRYLRYDCDYDLSDLGNDSGTLFGMAFADEAGSQIAGVFIRSDWGATNTPTGLLSSEIAGGLETTGQVSVICRVDLDDQMMDVWYGLNGANGFEETSPDSSGIALNLDSIDNLRLHATGDFSPVGSDDGVTLDNLRMAASWDAIIASIPEPVAPNSLFRDGLVLQRNLDVPVWGRAVPGAAVTVYLDGSEVGSAVADAAGEWIATIGIHEDDGGTPHVITISSPGVPNVVVSNVVLGDVYLASGQSNMARLMPYSAGYAEEAASANYPLLRQVRIAQTESVVKLDDAELDTEWLECSPATVAQFGAVAYFFGKNIHLETGVPVGLIHSAWGGKKIQRFLSPDGVTAVPELAGIRQYIEEGGLTDYHDIYNAMTEPLAPYGISGAIGIRAKPTRMTAIFMSIKCGR